MINLTDLFTLAALTDAVNKLPAAPGKIGQSGLFREKGVTTTAIVIDEEQGRLVLVDSTSRNSDGQSMVDGERKRRTFSTLHLALNGQILADDLQGKPAPGVTNAPAPATTAINDKLERLKASIEATREFLRLGAIKGQLLRKNGTVMTDLYTEFGVTKKALNVPFSSADDVKKFLLDAKRHAESKLAGVVVQGWRCYCSPEFYDALTAHKSVKEAFANWQAAADRLGSDMRSGFTFMGIEFIEYNIQVGSTTFIAANKAHFFPVAPSIFVMYQAPANYNETVNTVGLPWYSKAQPREMDKGWKVEVQSNPLPLCLYPETLVEFTAT